MEKFKIYIFVSQVILIYLFQLSSSKSNSSSSHSSIISATLLSISIFSLLSSSFSSGLNSTSAAALSLPSLACDAKSYCAQSELFSERSSITNDPSLTVPTVLNPTESQKVLS
eukprot:72226_1